MYISTVRGFHLGQLNYHRRDENVTYREWTRKRERERSIGLVGMRTYICLIYEAKRESWYDACYYDARDARRRLAGSREIFFFFQEDDDVSGRFFLYVRFANDGWRGDRCFFYYRCYFDYLVDALFDVITRLRIYTRAC